MSISDNDNTPIEQRYPKTIYGLINVGAGLTALGIAKVADWATSKVSSSTSQQASKVMGGRFTIGSF